MGEGLKLCLALKVSENQAFACSTKVRTLGMSSSLFKNKLCQKKTSLKMSG